MKGYLGAGFFLRCLLRVIGWAPLFAHGLILSIYSQGYRRAVFFHFRF